jgi:hypothetical protein
MAKRSAAQFGVRLATTNWRVRSALPSWGGMSGDLSSTLVGDACSAAQDTPACADAATRPMTVAAVTIINLP